MSPEEAAATVERPVPIRAACPTLPLDDQKHLGCRGLVGRLDALKSPVPDSPTHKREHWRKEPERTNWVELVDSHTQFGAAPVGWFEEEGSFWPNRPDVSAERDSPIRLERGELHRRLSHLVAATLVTETECRARRSGPWGLLHNRLGVRISRVLVESKQEAIDILDRPRDRDRGFDLPHPWHPPPPCASMQGLTHAS